MKFIFIIMVLFSAQAFANSGSIHYATGPLAGKDMIKNPSHFGYDEICFKGNPLAARAILYKHMSEDYELESVFARYVASDKVIVYGYVNTKCTDEMPDEPEDCRSVQIAKKCK